MTQAPSHASTDASSSSSSTRHRWLAAGGEGARVRAGVAVRALVAVFGGYLFSALLAAVLALYWPADRLEASLTGTLAAVTVYPCAVMWVFAARTAARAALGLLLPCALMGLAVALRLLWGSAA